MVRRSRPHALVKLTADLVILTVRGGPLQVLLVERGNEPFAGQLALPGGFLRDGESVDQAARRELAEETGLDADALLLEQIGCYSAVDRDPRGRVVTVAFLAIAPELPVPRGGSDARRATWFDVEVALADPAMLAFDHHEILTDAVEQARAKLEDSPIATAFCGDEFTIGELRRVYEVVWGVTLDPGNFSRKVTKIEGFLEPVGSKRRLDTGRPAELYRRGDANGLHPPLLRP